MADIFISYSSHDREKAVSLAEELRACGTTVWIDQAIDGAMQWSSEIAQALDECKALILLVSKSSLSSKNCAKEVTIAAESDKHILPIDLEDIALPREFKYHLAGLHRVPYSNKDLIRRAIEKLGLAISGTDSQSVGGAASSSQGGLIRRGGRPTFSDPIRIAVLPFDDLSQKKDNAWFADGMMDELIGTLSQVQKLRVASRPEVIYYKKHRPKAKKIADDLKVRYLIEGSVRKAGKKIRITASLTDMAFGEQLWMNNYDGTFKDVFDFQESVSKKITESLKLKLTPEEEKAIEEKPTENVEAYELYLKGLEFHRQANRQAYEDAFKLYEAAITLDDNFVDAHLGIANTSVAYYRECSRNQKWLVQAEHHLKKAQTTSGETAKTLWIGGEIAWQKENFEEAERLLRRGAELDPSFAPIFNILGNLYLKSERPLLATQAFETALKISETNVTYFNFLAALSHLDDPLRLEEMSVKALPIMEKYFQDHKQEMFAKVSYAITLSWANRKEEALTTADEFVAQDSLDGISLFNLGNLYEKLGSPHRNLELLKRAIDKGFREIEACKGQTYSDPELQEQFEMIVAELETIIEKEKKGI
jgi:TolB-like protein